MTSPILQVDTQKRLRTYQRAEAVVVYKTKENFGGLSNMASGYPLVVNSVPFLTTEALYQTCRFPSLPEVQREIIIQKSPMTAKMKGKPHRSNTRPDWDSVRFKIMRWCLRVKLAQNYNNFGNLLLSTGEKPIVEQSRNDDYWGAKVMDGDMILIGQNILGRLLMELRERLRQEDKIQLLRVEPLKIPDFLLLGKPIETVNENTSTINKPQSSLW